MSNDITKSEVNVIPMDIDYDTLQKIIIDRDISGMTPEQKMNWAMSICKDVGLNIKTGPIQFIPMKGGKEILYFKKEATDQLRRLHDISITNVDTKILANDLYVVTVYAKTPGGRVDSATAAICIKNLGSDDMANALMKAETKAKRRVTLSICGLGFTDESELDTMPVLKKEVISVDDAIENIHNASDLNSLRNLYMKYYKYFEGSPELIERLSNAKDGRKETLSNVTNLNEGE